jgi:hypothetical protein
MSWGARPAIALLGCLALLLRAERARALEIGLEMPSCPQLPAPRVRELMELELTAKVVLPQGSEPLSALVSVACRADQVSIQVSDATTSKLVSRSFVVSQPDPDVRARAVALAAAELVLTSWMELMLTRPVEHEPPTPRQVKEDRRAAGNLVKRRTLSGGVRVDALLALAEWGGSLRAAPGNFGGGARVSLASGVLGVDADVIATFEDEASPLGRVRSNAWSLALRPALRLERGRWLASTGVGARAGLARIEGSAADPSAADSHVVAGGWGGPLLHANLGVALEHLVARFGGEAGFALQGVSGRVEGSERAGVRGPWFMLTLGIGWGS